MYPNITHLTHLAPALFPFNLPAKENIISKENKKQTNETKQEKQNHNRTTRIKKEESHSGTVARCTHYSFTLRSQVFIALSHWSASKPLAYVSPLMTLPCLVCHAVVWVMIVLLPLLLIIWCRWKLAPRPKSCRTNPALYQLQNSGEQTLYSTRAAH